MKNSDFSKIFLSFIFLFFINVCRLAAQSVNELTVSDTVITPLFSVERGIYSENFDLTISSYIPDATIKYTLDCSDPNTSATAITHESPVTIKVDPESTEGGRAATPGFIVRACTVTPNQSMSESITNTYLFINEVEELSPSGKKPGSQWPDPTTSSNPQSIDYGLASDVLNDPRYKGKLVESLFSIPTISLTTDLKNLFDRNTGIYMNAYSDGIEWERPASLELLNSSAAADDSAGGFQINCGIRIRGGASRSGSNRKHAFRVFFRNEYGKGKLKYPLFGDEGVDEFDNIDLRTSQNYSWSFPDHLGQYNTMNRDVFTRDLQGKMSQPYTRSRYYHLYLDGVYWGLYQSQERPEASFASSYLGGAKESYDVVKAGDGWPSAIEATDGDLDAYRQIWDLCVTGFQNNETYFKLQGLDENGNLNRGYKNLVDIDNLIDFMLLVFYTGNFDCPTSKFGNNNTPRNFYAVYNRNANEGFKFITHDNEHSLRTTAGEGPGIGLNENRVNIGDLKDSYRMVVNYFNTFHPQWLHYKLSVNAEYRLRFADHVYKYFFNNGLMTPDKAAALFVKRANEISKAIIAESARWGDVFHSPSRNKDDDWQEAVDDIIYNYFPERTAIVLKQLQDAELYADINPPMFMHESEEITSSSVHGQVGYKVKIQKPNNTSGTIWYTTDDSDPRTIGGSVNTSAKEAEDYIELTANETTIIKTRLLNSSTWSALHELTIFAGNKINDIKITEINYHPLDGNSTSDNNYEFLELKNIGDTPVDLSGTSIVDGINYSFPNGTIIKSNGFIVLASNSEDFYQRYGFLPFGQYSGRLDNGGDKIVFIRSVDDTIFSITYNDKSPWPDKADGNGYTLVPKDINPLGDLNDPNNWRASYYVNGSPGQDDLLTSVSTINKEVPSEFQLYQNYPNPFNPTTTIRFSIPNVEIGHCANPEQVAPSLQFVMLKVYDILGREIATLVNEQKSPGNYEVSFDANHAGHSRSMASGIYFYKLSAGNFVSIKKMLLLK